MAMRSAAERRENADSIEMKCLNGTQRERYNRRQVHIIAIRQAYESIHSTSFSEATEIELQLKKNWLHENYVDFRKEHKALVTTLTAENFKIANDVGAVIDDTYLRTMAKLGQRIKDLSTQPIEESKKSKDNDTKTLKRKHEESENSPKKEQKLNQKMVDKMKKELKKRHTLEIKRRIAASRHALKKKQQTSENTVNKDKTQVEKPHTVTTASVTEPQNTGAGSSQQLSQKSPLLRLQDELIMHSDDQELAELMESPTNSPKKVQSVIVRIENDRVNDLRSHLAIKRESEQAEMGRDETRHHGNHKHTMQQHDRERRNIQQQNTDRHYVRRQDAVEEPRRDKVMVCHHCTRNHPITLCPRFKALGIAERRERVRQLTLCINCFTPLLLLRHRHICTKGPCSCMKRHNTLLCFKPRTQQRNV